jgi:signal transduction histidine kinase
LPVLVSVRALQARPATGQLAPIDESVALVVHQDVSVLKQAENLKDEFIALAAHELRNPLAALKGFADMLVYQTARGKGPALASWQQEALAEIVQASARLDKLTQDLLDVTRLQAGRLIMSRKPTELVNIIRRLVMQAQMTTQRHSITLLTPLSSLTVDVDHIRIEQVVSNVLSNAVKYSPQEGSIEVSLWEELEPHALLLSVRDHGIGIPISQQARIFGRFVRAENAREMEIAGTGLGLYLSRELVELHGGHLWFESTEGTGTTFFLKIPIS